MKVLFIFKNENFLVPTGLCAISAIVRQEGIDSCLCEMNSHDPLKYIAELKPDVVAYSSSSGEAKHYLNLNRLIKKKFPQVFTIMGGAHPTFYPKVICEDSLDAVCIGEGEYAFLDLLKAISSNSSYDNISNIVTRDNRDRFMMRNLVEDLDRLPFPDYALIYNNTALGRYPLKSIVTSRGCPYDCTYCFNSAWRKIYTGRGRVVRRHSVGYVIDEIKYVMKKWPLSFVKFYDDIFTYCADEWLEEFSKKYSKYISLPFFILTRPDLLTEDMVKLLKQAGCRTISMSIEAGREDIRAKMLRRHITDEQIIQAHRLCERYGIYTFTNCIIGLPESNIKDDIESVDLSIKSKVSWAEFPIFYPYPGTELGQYTIDKGYYHPNFKEMHTSYQSKSLLNCFTQKEKNTQMNLALLGPVAIAFPFYKNIIFRFLIYMRHNFIFTFIYYLTKMYILRRKIYVTKTNFWVSISIFVNSLKQEWFRHENKRG